MNQKVPKPPYSLIMKYKKLTFTVLMIIVYPLAGHPKQKLGGNHYVGRYFHEK